MDQIVAAIQNLNQHVLAIIDRIRNDHDTHAENNKYILNAFAEQKAINEKLEKRLKDLEEAVGEQYLLGERK